MKLNLILGQQSDLLNGYINVCPFAEQTTNEIVRGQVDRLDDYIDDGEAAEVLATDVLEYFTMPAANLALNNWIKKLSHGGLLVLGITELLEVAKALGNRSISTGNANILLHGAARFPEDVKRASYTCGELSEILKNKGLKVVQKRIDGFLCFIKAVRP